MRFFYIFILPNPLLLLGPTLGPTVLYLYLPYIKPLANFGV